MINNIIKMKILICLHLFIFVIILVFKNYYTLRAVQNKYSIMCEIRLKNNNKPKKKKVLNFSVICPKKPKSFIDDMVQ